MNDMRKLMEMVDANSSGHDMGLPEAEFDQFVNKLTSIDSTKEQLRTLYLWTKADNGLSEDDFLDLAEYVVGYN